MAMMTIEIIYVQDAILKKITIIKKIVIDNNINRNKFIVYVISHILDN